MKRTTLITALLFTGAIAFGQGADRTSAIMAFNGFNKAIQDQNLDKAEKELKEAKKFIDLAYTANPTDHKTLYYKGQIYSTMPLTLIDPASAMALMSDPCSGKPKYRAGLDEKKTEAELKMYVDESMNAFKEAMKNPGKKDDFTGDIKRNIGIQAVITFNCGSKFYNEKKYVEAAEAFQESVKLKEVIGQADTLGIYNTALCYERVKNHEGAAEMWKKCTEIKYGGADAYSGMANAYSALGKEDESLKALKAGRAAYPKDLGMIISEVNYYLGKGDNASAEKAINEAIALDSKNPTLYFALGSVYDNLKQYAKAEESYKKALAIDPSYFDALFNLGAMKYNEGAELMNKIKDIADDAQYTAEKAKADEMFKQALPYNEKAREVNPKDRDNLMMLKNIYARTGDTAKATEITNLLKN